jgi:hypothetical protein
MPQTGHDRAHPGYPTATPRPTQGWIGERNAFMTAIQVSGNRLSDQASGMVDA